MRARLPWWMHDFRAAVLQYPGRSLLMILALTVGSGSAGMLQALRGGMAQRAGTVLQDFGADTLEIRLQDGAGFSAEHLRTLQAEFPEWILAGAREITVPGAFPLLQATPAWAAFAGGRLRQGRWLDMEDDRSRAPYAVACTSLGLPLGAAVPGLQPEVRIVGLAGLQSRIWVPESLLLPGAVPAPALEILKVRPRAVAATPPSAPQLLAAVQRMTPEARLTLTTAESLLAQSLRWQRQIFALLGGVTLLFWVLGGCTVVSLLLLQLLHRRREIALRMTLGAGPVQIFGQFLREGLLLGAVAGFTGVGGSWLLLHQLPLPEDLPWIWNPGTAASSFGLSLTVTLLFVSLPALRAAQLTRSSDLRG